MALLEGMVLVECGLSVISEEHPSCSVRSPHAVMEPQYLLTLGKLGILCVASLPHSNYCSLMCFKQSWLNPRPQTGNKHLLRSMGPIWTTSSSLVLYPQSLAAPNPNHCLSVQQDHCLSWAPIYFSTFRKVLTQLIL